jgi:hypothetical protein
MKDTLHAKYKILIMMRMMTRKILVLLLFLFSSAISYSQDADFGLWYSIAAEKELVKNIELDLDANLRTFDNASKIEETFLDIGLTYKFNKFLSAAVSYRFTEFNEDDGSFHPRHKWFADLKGKFPLGDFDISARLRYQQRYKTYFEDENDKESKKVGRIKLKTLYDIPSFPLNPYISAELFFPLFIETARSVEKKRFAAGLEYKISKKHSIEAEYMFQRDHYPKLYDINIISLNYQLKF